MKLDLILAAAFWFFALLVGVALLQTPKEKGKTVLSFFNGLNEVIIKIVQYIMMLAPYGVFALIAALIVEIAGDQPDKAPENREPGSILARSAMPLFRPCSTR